MIRKALILKPALVATMLAVNINAFSQSTSPNKLEISTLSGEQFSCTLSGVSRIAVRDGFAYIISTHGEHLFTFELSPTRRQTVVLVSANGQNKPGTSGDRVPHGNRPSGGIEPGVDIGTSASALKNPASQASIFPNPSTGSISIRGAGENPLVRVISTQGAVMMTAQGSEADISNLPSGTYIITVNNQAFKIIKQ